MLSATPSRIPRSNPRVMSAHPRMTTHPLVRPKASTRKNQIHRPNQRMARPNERTSTRRHFTLSLSRLSPPSVPFHRPVEVTSKRPVSRRRVVVDDTLPVRVFQIHLPPCSIFLGDRQKPRDPRFMHATGRYEPSKFKQQYDFLSGLHDNELATLREHVKRARKLLANSPSHLRAEREEEVTRLERTMKRAESTVNLDNRERVELEALQSAKQAEKEKRKQGKAGWWMKRCKPFIRRRPFLALTYCVDVLQLKRSNFWPQPAWMPSLRLGESER